MWFSEFFQHHSSRSSILWRSTLLMKIHLDMDFQFWNYWLMKVLLKSSENLECFPRVNCLHLRSGVYRFRFSTLLSKVLICSFAWRSLLCVMASNVFDCNSRCYQWMCCISFSVLIGHLYLLWRKRLKIIFFFQLSFLLLSYKTFKKINSRYKLYQT